jgi:hypothetical protein
MNRIWIAGGSAAIVLAGAALLVARPHAPASSGTPGPAAPTKRPDVVALRSLAVQSCNCERSHYGKSEKNACWKPFNAAIKPWQSGDEGFMMCGDPTEQSIELTTGETIVTRYVSERGAEFCTVDEARAGEAAFDKAERIREHDPKAPSGDDVLDRLAAEFARGQRAEVALKEGGCTTG